MTARLLSIVLALVCAGCSEENARADEVKDATSSSPTHLAKGKWAPRDTCTEVEGADLFRANLATAVKARDADALVALAADDVELDFNGGEGPDELRSRLDAEAGLWDELDKLMTLGCSANANGNLAIPWLFDQDLGDVDPFSTLLVTAEDEPVRAGPSASAQQIGTVSWDLVETALFDWEAPFQPVTLADGREGYIATGKLRSVIDFRLIAARQDGRWKITALVAGD
ncbi:SH3 domain-containing protein [Altererythrobacter sp. Root672]|uniref:SH3 domain-containing protein n=1 Tax=Altererythrobacter sp. Root672 TaxID=1736584 RepID=UPI0006FDBE26|nr:SH3 domain-containing protein [Altererythrobacter sp. Root672]KRA83834.1 hypothetical protein ASD76_07410 [Altererythrobacter sp. Root672]